MSAFVPVETFFEPSAESEFVGNVALILAAAGGLVARRWWEGLIVSAVIVIAVHGLLLGLPTVAVGKPFPWKALRYTLFWLPVVLLYARVLLAFTLAFSLRNLFDIVRQRLQRRARR